MILMAPETQSARILVVDDEIAHMRAICDTLQDRGFAVSGFTSGEPALAALREDKYDLILADLMMPGMDGIALLQSAVLADPEIVGIIMTGEGTIATAVEAMKIGALDYILKPFKVSAILPVLSRALTVQKLRHENVRLERCLHERADELEAANKELEAFSYSISHDLRAPLRAISGFSRILDEDCREILPEDAKKLLADIVGSVRRMEELIDGLLNLSRLSRSPLSKHDVDMSALAEEALWELSEQKKGRLVETRLVDLPMATGDPTMLRQVFVNLLANAYKFSRKKERAVIEIGFEQQDGENVYFVRDNGAGFDLRYADKLFGAFQRMHGFSEFEGTGIGLSIVHRIIQRHGGRIWADAAVDQGATFRFTL